MDNPDSQVSILTVRGVALEPAFFGCLVQGRPALRLFEELAITKVLARRRTVPGRIVGNQGVPRLHHSSRKVSAVHHIGDKDLAPRFRDPMYLRLAGRGTTGLGDLCFESGHLQG